MFSKSQIGQEDGAHLPRIHGRRQRQRPEALHHGEDVVLPSCGAERQPGALGWRYHGFDPKRGERMGSKMVQQSKKLETVGSNPPKKMV